MKESWGRGEKKSTISKISTREEQKYNHYCNPKTIHHTIYIVYTARVSPNTPNGINAITLIGPMLSL